MKTVRNKSWIFFAFLGFYLIASALFDGPPVVIKKAIYVILGGITMWLSLIDFPKEENEIPVIK